jgi:hypothetical protein
MALLGTARLAFLLFWSAYAGGALVALFGRAFQPLRRRAREFGVAFAAVQSVHLGLVAWLCLIGAAPSTRTFVFFGIAAVWVYALALFSINGLQQRLGTMGWWVLRTVGMNFVAYAFAVDFFRSGLAGGIAHVVLYWPFATLAAIGPGLRLAAAAQRAGSGWRGMPQCTERVPGSATPTAKREPAQAAAELPAAVLSERAWIEANGL